MLLALIPILYVQISPERLTVRNPKTGVTISEVPEIAITPGPRPIAKQFPAGGQVLS